jgi:hypothetical protein
MTVLAAASGATQLGDTAALTDGYSAAFLGAAAIAQPQPSWPRSPCTPPEAPHRTGH